MGSYLLLNTFKTVSKFYQSQRSRYILDNTTSRGFVVVSCRDEGKKRKTRIRALCDDVFEEKETRISFQHVLVRNENSIAVFYLSAVVVAVFNFFQFPRLFLLILYIASVRILLMKLSGNKKKWKLFAVSHG